MQYNRLMSMRQSYQKTLPLPYNQKLKESNDFFGSFFSFTKNIYFKKYRQDLHKRYEFRDDQAVAWFTMIYFVATLLGITLLLLVNLLFSFFVYEYFYNDNSETIALLVAATNAAAMISIILYVVWPQTYAYMRHKGIVRRKQ